jgi:hypothetical protein
MDLSTSTGSRKRLEAHRWDRAGEDWYVEPAWCSERLFEEEPFVGTVWDPACGGGNIPEAAKAAGYGTHASDLVDRGYPGSYSLDFFKSDARHAGIVTNPPFKIAGEFALHALKLAHKVAIIFPTARLNAAHWITGTPLRRVWLLSPRPSMPPGHVIAAGGKPSGGKMDYCWLVLDRAYTGSPELRWLRRDGQPKPDDAWSAMWRRPYQAPTDGGTS